MHFSSVSNWMRLCENACAAGFLKLNWSPLKSVIFVTTSPLSIACGVTHSRSYLEGTLVRVLWTCFECYGSVLGVVEVFW